MASDDAPRERPDQEELFLAVLAYIPVFCLLPSLSRTDSEFARSHGRQGTVIFLLEIGAGMVSFLPVIGFYAGSGLLAACLIVSALGVRQVIQGKIWKLPFIGPMADRLHNLAP